MEKRLDQLSQQLESLLLEKTYEALNASEKKEVLQTISAEEYTAFRAILLESKLLFAESKKHEAPAMRPHLQQLVKKNRSRPQLWVWLEQAMHYPLPSWQPALGLLAILAFFFSPLSNSAESVQTAKPIYVYQTDTVYNNTTDTIYKERPSSKPRASTSRLTASSSKKIKVKKVNTKPNIQNRTEPQEAALQDQIAISREEPEELQEVIAFHLDTTVLRQRMDPTMSRDSGHSLNEVEGIMDFFVEIY